MAPPTYYQKADRRLNSSGRIYDRLARDHWGQRFYGFSEGLPSVNPATRVADPDARAKQIFADLISGNANRGYMENLRPRSTTARAQDVTSAMQPFMNTFDDEVINQAITRLGEARNETTSQIGADAANAGAFGGSRHALLEAKANEDYMQRASEVTSQLKQQSFAQAMQQALGLDQATDAFNLNRANTMLQGEQVDLNTAVQNFNALLGFNQLNQNADNLDTNAALQRAQLDNQRGQIELSADQQAINRMLAAAAGRQGLSDTYYGRVTGQEDRIFQQESMQQQVNQNVLNNSYQQFQQMLSDPYRAIELMSGVASQDPRMNNMTISSAGRAEGTGKTTQKTRHGFFDYMSLAFGGLGAASDANLIG